MPATAVGTLAGARGGRRLVEWGLFAVLLVILMLVFLRQARVVQGQAELAAIRTTVAALRTAAVLQHLQQQAGRVATVAIEQRSPFDLLQVAPSNYRGELDAAQRASVAPGSWFFELPCDCVGYAPLEPAWLSSASGDGAIRFQVVRGRGPLQLTVMDLYQWQGEAID